MTTASPDPAFRRRVEAYAALVRVPNLFTAPPDVIAGAAIAVATGATDATGGVVGDVAGLAVASILLYAGGTTLNDYFDAEVDARERPERPIPSGRVPRRTALALGGVLLVAGVGVATSATGVAGGALAAMLAAVILLYDSVLKGHPTGYAAMGGARTLNVVLGTTVGGLIGVHGLALAVPLTVGVYIATVTYMAADEATATDRRPVMVAGAGVGLAALAAPVVVWVAGAAVTRVVLAVTLAGGFAAWTGRALRTAYVDPAPATVGPAVGTCVLGLVVVDASVAAVAGVPWAIATVAFLVPAVGLARAFDVS